MIPSAPENPRPPILSKWRDGADVVEVHAVSDLHVVARFASKPHPPETCPLVYTRREFAGRCTPLS